MFFHSMISLLVYYVQLSSAQQGYNASITAKPTYCGECSIDYGVGAHVWLTNTSTIYVATVVYQVIAGSGTVPPQTIGSTTKTQPMVTTFANNSYFSSLAGIYGNSALNQAPQKGAVEYTFLNNLTAGQTLQQTNYLEFFTYRLNTIGRNTSASGSPLACMPATTTPPGSAFAASEVIFNYTATVSFDENNDIYSAESAGLQSYFSAFQKSIGLNCSYSGGGVGTIKVPVTALTTTETNFVTAQAQVEETTPVPGAASSSFTILPIATSTTTTQAVPTSTGGDEFTILPISPIVDTSLPSTKTTSAATTSVPVASILQSAPSSTSQTTTESIPPSIVSVPLVSSSPTAIVSTSTVQLSSTQAIVAPASTSTPVVSSATSITPSLVSTSTASRPSSLPSSTTFVPAQVTTSDTTHGTDVTSATYKMLVMILLISVGTLLFV